jgi:hypothetical protein
MGRASVPRRPNLDDLPGSLCGNLVPRIDEKLQVSKGRRKKSASGSGELLDQVFQAGVVSHQKHRLDGIVQILELLDPGARVGPVQAVVETQAGVRDSHLHDACGCLRSLGGGGQDQCRARLELAKVVRRGPRLFFTMRREWPLEVCDLGAATSGVTVPNDEEGLHEFSLC